MWTLEQLQHFCQPVKTQSTLSITATNLMLLAPLEKVILALSGMLGL